MKIAITAEKGSLDAALDPRFGRCAWFIILNTASPEAFTAVENLAASAGGGAGVQASQAIIDAGVRTVISGNFGPKAYDALNAAGISMCVVEAQTVREAVEAFNAGKGKLLDSPSAAAHAGLRRI